MLLHKVDDYILHPFSKGQLNKKIENLIYPNINNVNLKNIIFEKIQKMSLIQSVMFETLGTLAEYRDPETGGHIKRTKNYVKALAMELMKLDKYKKILNEEIIEKMYMAVPLHDIGKVGIRDNILLKPGKLTSEEFEIMKLHTIFGHETIFMEKSKIGQNDFLDFADDVTYTHHEKWDGSGYPRGLKGEEIPLIGRLMAIADVYDALVSKRVYKDAYSHEKAKDIIESGRGRHFDPTMVDAFMIIKDVFKNISEIYSDEEYTSVTPNKSFMYTDKIKNIMLVDDNKIMLTIFTNQIKNLGFNVYPLLNSQEAFDLLEKEDIHLVITDLEMPNLNGFELTKEIRRRKYDIPIFALTSANFDFTKQEIKQFGFSDFMLKPLDTKILKLKLSKLKRLSKKFDSLFNLLFKYTHYIQNFL
jgi:putative two-component system response regulator